MAATEKAASMAAHTIRTPAIKFLDPTKIGGWKLVVKPPIGEAPVLQGKTRDPASNAAKDHQMKEGVRLRRALQAMTHGRDIFVYHNIRTNQVVYSLTRYLQVCLSIRRLNLWITKARQLLMQDWDRKTTSSNSSSSTAKRPSPQRCAKICGCRTTRCTSRTGKSGFARTISSGNSRYKDS